MANLGVIQIAVKSLMEDDPILLEVSQRSKYISYIISTTFSAAKSIRGPCLGGAIQTIPVFSKHTKLARKT